MSFSRVVLALLGFEDALWNSRRALPKSKCSSASGPMLCLRKHVELTWGSPGKSMLTSPFVSWWGLTVSSLVHFIIFLEIVQCLQATCLPLPFCLCRTSFLQKVRDGRQISAWTGLRHLPHLLLYWLKGIECKKKKFPFQISYSSYTKNLVKSNNFWHKTLGEDASELLTSGKWRCEGNLKMICSQFGLWTEFSSSVFPQDKQHQREPRNVLLYCYSSVLWAA